VFGLLSGSLSIVFVRVCRHRCRDVGPGALVSRLVSRESENRRFQFGYWHIGADGAGLQRRHADALCFYAFLNAVDSFLAGGPPARFRLAIAYAVTVCIVLLRMGFYEFRANRKIGSDFVRPRRAELADVGGGHLGALVRLRHRLVAQGHAATATSRPTADPVVLAAADALAWCSCHPHVRKRCRKSC